MAKFNFFSSVAVFWFIAIFTVFSAEVENYNCSALHTYDAKTPGIITSPLYGKQEYPNNIQCKYEIKAPEGYRIKITFEDFDLTTSTACKQDRLVLYGNDVLDSRIGVFCGSELPNPILSKQGEHIINMAFVTDFLTGGRGFRIRYESSPHFTSVCADGYIECTNRNCYKSDQKCDGVDDCGDGTDEENCKRPIRIRPEICGMPEIQSNASKLDVDRMVGGHDAVPNSWPWQVSLQNAFFEPNGHFCGGTLINAQWVLTATHCVTNYREPGMIRIHLGSHSKTKKSQYEQVRRSARIISFPNLEGYMILKFSIQNDLTLIKLNAPVTFNKGVQPACLPSAKWEVKTGWHCYATGWGETRGTGGSNVLKQSEQIVLSRTNCRFNPSTQICVQKRNSSPCHGDSGGPLNCKFKGKWYAFGAASYVTAANFLGGLCTGPEAKTIYSSSVNKAEWIQNTIRSYS